jgi:hypothetical protein
MNAKAQKEIVLHLIFNDLVNCKLIYGLRALHIDAGVYSLCMAESIFTLMGLAEAQRTHERYDRYAALCRKATDIPYTEGQAHALQALALEMYEDLARGF